MPKEKWFKVFKIGKHVDNKGNEKEFTEQDLENIANTYNNQKEHKAPLVIGHPQTEAPAHGWVEELKKEGGDLFAKISNFSNEIVNAIKEKKYLFPSISLYGNGLLRHIGLLGAVPPAVKGLGEFELSDDIQGVDVVQFTFNENFEKHGTVIYDIKTDTEPNIKDELEAYKIKTEQLEKELSKLKEFADNTQVLQVEITTLADEKAKAEEKLNELNVKLQLLQFEQYLNEKIAYGTLTPALANQVLKILEALNSVEMSEEVNGVKVFEFSEKNDKGEIVKVKQNPIEVFKSFIDSLPKIINFNEQQKKPQTDDDTKEFSEKYPDADENTIKTLAAAKKIANDKKISFDKAITMILKTRKQ